MGILDLSFKDNGDNTIQVSTLDKTRNKHPLPNKQELLDSIDKGEFSKDSTFLKCFGTCSIQNTSNPLDGVRSTSFEAYYNEEGKLVGAFAQ